MLDDDDLIVGTKVVVRPFWRRLASTLLIVILVGLIGGFVVFAESLEHDRIAATDAPRADAIAVLTGGKERLKAGFEVLLAQKGARLLITGVGEGTSVDDLRAELGVGNTMAEVARFACCIDLDHTAHDTEGNAIAIADWVKSNTYTSVLVVTSAYHMPRALTELRGQIGTVELLSHPVQSDSVKLNGWWGYPGTMLLLFEEYLKTIAAYVRGQL